MNVAISNEFNLTDENFYELKARAKEKKDHYLNEEALYEYAWFLHMQSTYIKTTLINEKDLEIYLIYLLRSDHLSFKKAVKTVVHLAKIFEIDRLDVSINNYNLWVRV
ncbi:hypothetical protein [Bacillus altitudinis]|uniref:hypothetical protein n=1 Tax=Bacillus altitudinis TaxID=293387 RepID=UPI001C21A19E|nr:hypothetical protein [Bacillus sp. FJAT-26377]